MSEAIITRRGGGSGGKAFAVIHVDYPEGSICTCTNGMKTLKAKDTSGLWNFAVPSAGTWTVECHTEDGIKRKSQSVSITAQDQAESVLLDYVLYLFKEGEGVAQGYSTKQVRQFVSKDYINIQTAGGGGALSFIPAIDFEPHPYKVLRAEFQFNYDSSRADMKIGVRNTDSTDNTFAVYGKFNTSGKRAGGRYIVECDVSTLTIAGYVGIYGDYCDNNRCYNVWLE